jgi:hypothetical protein
LGDAAAILASAWPQQVAQPSLAVDRRPQADENLDIAVDRAQRHGKLVRQTGRRHRPAMPAKGVHQREQAFGAIHVSVTYG